MSIAVVNPEIKKAFEEMLSHDSCSREQIMKNELPPNNWPLFIILNVILN